MEISFDVCFIHSTHPDYCNGCSKPILPGHLRLLQRLQSYNKVFHLDCFEAKEYVPKANILFGATLSSDDRSRATESAYKLNLGKTPTDRPRFDDLGAFLIKKLDVPPSRTRRVYLEVFKFLPGRFIGQVLAVV
jgi:hypothetical protein